MPRFENPSIAGPEFRDKRKPFHRCTAFPKLMCVRTQRSSGEAFRFFGKNFPTLGRSLPIFRRSLPVCGGVAPQMHFGKAFRIVASILKTRIV